jgi:DNA (cytosine-5)-methyltransferase 1
MRMSAYYNEIDPLKAEIIREAIKADAIAPGDVDEQSIVDVRPDDLMGYTQCHFFAGGGFWSFALRQAGWPDDRPVWTGSCPCPSFSAAGKGQGFTDPRHLWPAWARLICECRPPTIFGEQVSAAIGHGWLDLVQTDLEAEDYAVGKIVLGACSVGAPHIRQRLFFVAEKQQGSEIRGQGSVKPVADATDARRQAAGQYNSGQPLLSARPEQCIDAGIVEYAAQRGCGVGGDAAQQRRGGYADCAEFALRLGEPSRKRLEGHAGNGGDGNQPGRDGTQQDGSVAEAGESCGLAYTDSESSNLHGWQRTRISESAGRSQTGNLANADGGESGNGELQRSGEQRQQPQDSGAGNVGISQSERRQSGPAWNEVDGEGMESAKRKSIKFAAGSEDAGSVAEPLHAEWGPFNVDGQDGRDGDDAGRQGAHNDFGTCGEVCRPSALNGFWRNADWIGCRDGKFRPVEPGSFPLVNGSAARVGRLRLYGDAICVPCATEFIKAYREIKEEVE